jgi:twitching motility two-component system response regulator PilH
MPIKNILIVDDSPTERHILTELLTGAGYQVTTAESGDEGVARAKQIMPDLVLMDVSKDDATKNIPVIMCTTKNQETDKLWGMRQGAQDYVTKPVDGPALLAKIAALG